MDEQIRTDEESRELAVFLVELREQCFLCMTAFAELRMIISNPPPSDEEGKRVYHSGVWLRVQAILSAGSNVSHILWPAPRAKAGSESYKRSRKRGLVLRTFLGISGRNPLIARKVRNAIEHVDERLDDWLPTVTEPIPLGWVISSLKQQEEAPDTKNAFRYLQVNSKELRVAGDRCNLDTIVRLVEVIEGRILDEAQVDFRKYG